MFKHSGANSENERLNLTGSAPVPLTTDVALWRVNKGKVDLFLEFAGRRYFVLTAEQGSCIFGSTESGEARFLVSGAAGSGLEALDPGALTQVELAYAADQWIKGLSERIANTPVDSHSPIYLVAGERHTLSEETILRVAKDPLWAILPANAQVQLADTEVVIDGPAALPLAGGIWLRMLAPSSLWTETSADLGRAETLLIRVTEFNQRIPAVIANQEAVQSASALARLYAEQSATERQVRESLNTLHQSTLAGDPRPAHSRATLGPVGASVACALETLNIRFDRKHLASSFTELADVPSVARRADVRFRRIVLRSDWHRHDLGPLVSTFGESRPVVTLIPASRGYRLFDPESGQTRKLTGQEASAIGPTAYCFYRSFSEKPQKIRDLIYFVFNDLKRDGLNAALSGAAIGLLATLVPLITAMIVDTVIPSNETVLLMEFGIALALVAVFSFLFTVTRDVALHRINGRTSSALQAAIWDRLLRLPAGFYRNYSAGDLAQRVAGIDTVRRAIVDVTLGASLTLVFSGFNLILLFVYVPGLAAIAVTLVLFLATITFIAGLLQIQFGRKMAAVDGELSAMVFQYLKGITKLRVAGAEARAFARWAERYAEERTARLKAGRIQNHYEAFSGSYEILSLATLYAATHWLIADAVSAGIFIAFLAAFGAFQSAFLRFARSLLSLLAVLPQYERGAPILAATPERNSSKVEPGRLTGSIKISGLHFGYGENGNAIFKGVNLSIAAGQSVALVGPSGSGKSTLLRLLLGFEHPTQGAILYDGQDLQSLDVSRLRRQIGVVLQSGQVFAGSILDNIRGSADLSIDECLEAAHTAGLADDLAQMPMGLHTPLTEGASTLSGGQRQRILIARALASNPEILILDEATSALDNRTQEIVTQTLERLGVTRITVAHRLSTVRKADKICFLDAGHILEEGTFDQLMALNGRFASLASRQLL